MALDGGQQFMHAIAKRWARKVSRDAEQVLGNANFDMHSFLSGANHISKLAMLFEKEL